MDCASSEFYHDGVYDYTKFEGAKGAKRTAEQQVAYLSELVAKYPIGLYRGRYGRKRLGRLETAD